MSSPDQRFPAGTSCEVRLRCARLAGGLRLRLRGEFAMDPAGTRLARSGGFIGKLLLSSGPSLH